MVEKLLQYSYRPVGFVAEGRPRELGPRRARPGRYSIFRSIFLSIFLELLGAMPIRDLYPTILKSEENILVPGFVR